MLITGPTRAQRDDGFATRPLCECRLLGLGQAVALFELRAEAAIPTWQSRRDSYEKALELYEAGDFAGCCQLLYPLLADQPDQDLPGFNHIGRAINALRSPPGPFDGVMDLGGST